MIFIIVPLNLKMYNWKNVMQTDVQRPSAEPRGGRTSSSFLQTMVLPEMLDIFCGKQINFQVKLTFA
ncbi:hypothetical protein SDC9_167766 [bioreactor metagenome]|uniref:Uncharacterized protein n=1 Tax=bioreactor metagenome TaxID=1076179 RepID=A0A645G0M7_9ZZZZ